MNYGVLNHFVAYHRTVIITDKSIHQKFYSLHEAKSLDLDFSRITINTQEVLLRIEINDTK